MSNTLAPAWYTDFFTELPNAWWRAAVPPEVTAAEVDFLVRVGNLGRGSRVLDVPCGSGRHALELARRGCRVTGIDISPEAVEHARRAAAVEHLDVDLRRGDMRAVPNDVVADLAACLGNSFGYLEHAQTQEFLTALAGAVVPGGRLVIDSATAAESLFPHGVGQISMSAGGIEMTAVNEYDPALSRLEIAFTFRQGDHEKRATCLQHVYTAGEMVRLLDAAGFDDVQLYGDVEGSPYRIGSDRLLLSCRRRAPER